MSVPYSSTTSAGAPQLGDKPLQALTVVNGIKLHAKTSSLTLPPAYTSGRGDHEECPDYSCSVNHSSTLLMKYEFDGPTSASKDRSWKPVNVELRGTLLLVRRTPSRPTKLYRRLSGVDAQQAQGPVSRSETRSFTLQGGEAGIAADYEKRAFVIRIRAEGEQFLLALGTLSSMLEWVDRLNTAIDISMPLESRRMPRNRTLPRDNVVSTMVLKSSVFMKTCALATRFWYGHGLELSKAMWSRATVSPISRADLQQQRARAVVSRVPLPMSDLTDALPKRVCPCAECDRRTTPRRTTPPASAANRDSTISNSPLLSHPGSFGGLPPDTARGEDDKNVHNRVIRPTPSSRALQLDWERRCASVVKYLGPRKHSFYVQNGQKVPISRHNVVPPVPPVPPVPSLQPATVSRG